MALVKLMHHDAKQTGGPLTADVPEVAVPIWLECGWRRVQAESAPVHEEESAAMPEEESTPVSEEESAPEPVQEAPAPAPEPRKRGRKKAAA